MRCGLVLALGGVCCTGMGLDMEGFSSFFSFLVKIRTGIWGQSIGHLDSTSRLYHYMNIYLMTRLAFHL